MTVSRAWPSALILALGASACGAGAPPAAADRSPVPVYSKQTGRLEQLVSDRDGDGRAETRAFMDGTRLLRIEIDRDGDGRPERTEFYAAGTGPAEGAVIERAEQSDGLADGISRREFYEAGRISRVEEDTDGDGRMDKWEGYAAGVLSKVELDLGGRGVPDQRLIYGEGGAIRRVESDADGDGVFTPIPWAGESRP
jgi:hypothetical protein